MPMNPRLMRPLARRQAPATDPYFSSVSLLLHFGGANNSTTFTDSSANAFTITPSGDAVISTAQSKFGGTSGYFDGTGDSCLSSPSSSAFAFDGAFTVEAWIYAISWPSYCWLCDFRNDSGAYTFGFGGGQFYPYLGATDWGPGGTALPTAEWVHIAFVYDGTDIRMYANGSLYRTETEPGITQGSSPIAIASRYSQDTEFFNGYIDELRVTKGVARYTANFTPPTAAFPNS